MQNQNWIEEHNDQQIKKFGGSFLCVINEHQAKLMLEKGISLEMYVISTLVPTLSTDSHNKIAQSSKCVL